MSSSLSAGPWVAPSRRMLEQAQSCASEWLCVPSPPEKGTFVVEGSIEVVAACVVSRGMLDQMASPRVASPWEA